MYGIIYKVTNLINGKLYIGLTTKNLEKRRKEHVKQVNNDSQLAFHRAIRKYGLDNFIWEVIDNAENKDELCNKEIYWISYYKTYTQLKNSNGYNMTVGGEGGTGRVFSEETKQIMSELKKGLFDGENNPMYGKHHTKETANKISKSLKGKYVGGKNPRAKAIIQLTLDGDFVAEHSNAKEVAVTRFNAVNGTNIIQCCRGVRKTAYGFIWVYKVDYESYSKEKILEMSRLAKLGICGENHARSQKVVKLDIDGNFIEEYQSAREGAKTVDGYSSEVSKCCKRNGKYKGYKWLYKKDYEINFK